jgi:hypothetical protein
MSRIFGRPSPAMVVACTALVIALGGTGYAAIRLPKNSVGSKQLKKNSVSSTKIKNHSLKSVDFKAGQLDTGVGTLAYRVLEGTADPGSATQTAITPLEVACPPGLFAISGQIDATPGLEMQSSYSSDGLGTGAHGITAWVGWVDNFTTEALPFSVLVACAPSSNLARSAPKGTRHRALRTIRVPRVR